MMGLTKLVREKLNQVLDKIEGQPSQQYGNNQYAGQHHQYPPGQYQPNPNYQYSNTLPPGQYNSYQGPPPPAPYNSHPSHQQAPPIPSRPQNPNGSSHMTNAPPIPSRPEQSNQSSFDPDGLAPPPPYAHSQSIQQAEPYWAPTFTPETPLNVHFDYDLGAGGWGNNELQTYTSFSQNAFYSPNRSLIVRAIAKSGAPADRDRFTSARLVSKQRLARRRGYLKAVLAAPSAKGIWPAFWLLPEEPFKWPEDGEVDVFEAWNGVEENHSCYHWGNYSDESHKRKHRVVTTRVPAITAPHEYGFAWDQPEFGAEGGRIILYVDGKPVMKCEKAPGTRRFEGFRVLLNIAMGGNVCDGKTPRDGSYQMEVFELIMRDDPPGGWSGFENDWQNTHKGKTLD